MTTEVRTGVIQRRLIRGAAAARPSRGRRATELELAGATGVDGPLAPRDVDAPETEEAFPEDTNPFGDAPPGLASARGVGTNASTPIRIDAQNNPRRESRSRTAVAERPEARLMPRRRGHRGRPRVGSPFCCKPQPTSSLDR
jgi:hypothetical protein